MYVWQTRIPLEQFEMPIESASQRFEHFKRGNTAVILTYAAAPFMLRLQLPLSSCIQTAMPYRI
jgi:hypothetical protein